MLEQNPVLTSSPPPPPKRSSIMRRTGCFIGLIIWFVLLLTPCFCLVMASQGEITINLGDVPGQSLRIWMVNEARSRGVAIARPTVYVTGNGDSICLQTDVSFVLWMGQGDAIHYCDCYLRGDNEWTLTSTASGDCSIR